MGSSSDFVQVLGSAAIMSNYRVGVWNGCQFEMYIIIKTTQGRGRNLP